MSSELRWQVFSSVWTRFHRLVIFGPTESFQCHRNIPLGATDFATGKLVCRLFYISSDPALLNESCPLQASQFYPLLCAESQGPNLYDGFQKALLGNRCQRGRKRSHQSSRGEKVSRIPDVVKGEREISQMLLRGRVRFPGRENTQGSHMLDVQEERCHMSFWGKDMFIWTHLNLVLFSSDFLFPIFSQYPM